MSQATAGALSGAASGAATGASTFGVYGAIAGGVIGGISGYMSGSAADEASEEQEEAMLYQAALAQVTARAKRADIVASKEQARHKNVGEMHDMGVNFMKERANAIAGAGEAGIAGRGVARTMADKFHQESQAKARGEYSLTAFKEDADRAISGVNIGLAGQVFEYEGVDDGDLMKAALMDIAGAGLKIGSAINSSGGTSAWLGGASAKTG